MRKKSCPAGISIGSILKDELRVANVWTKWVCNDMANASSSQAVCWRVFSRKAQAVSFSNLSAQELPPVRKGSWQRSCFPQWAFTFYTWWKAGLAWWPQNWTKSTDPECQDWWYIHLRNHCVVRSWPCCDYRRAINRDIPGAVPQSCDDCKDLSPLACLVKAR